MAHKRPTAPSTHDKTAYLEMIRSYHLPRYEEFPAIDLYMDQVLSYVDELTSPLLVAGDKPLSSSMVNNYVKQSVIPRPQAKKYGRDHIAYLIVVSILKHCFSISEIARLILIQIDTVDSAQAYDSFCTALEAILHRTFKEADASVAKMRVLIPENEADYPLRLMLSAITSVSNRLYVAKMLEFESSE